MDTTFEEYVMTVVPEMLKVRRPKKAHILEQPQHIYTHEDGEKRIHWTGKTERMAKDSTLMMHRLAGSRRDSQPKEGWGFRTYRQHYTEEMAAYVADAYRRDFELFGYEAKP